MIAHFYAQNFVLVIPLNEERRLLETCFRRGRARAGTFAVWKSCFEALIKDQHIRRQIEEDVKEKIGDMKKRDETKTPWAFSFVHTVAVGWKNFTTLNKVPAGTPLETFQPNVFTTAQAVPLRSTTLTAPLTKQLTIVCTIELLEKRQKDAPGVKAQPNVDWKVTVHSMYPGNEIELGERGNPRTIPPEEVVFFHPEHPGAPLPKVSQNSTVHR